MTEKLIRNEQGAIECLKKNKPTSGYYMLQESVDMAIKALEEVQQYRAIGTVEECLNSVNEAIDKHNLMIVFKDRLKEYEAIGTIEELQELKEKSVAKKPTDISKVRDCEGYIGLIGKCPLCGEILEEDTIYCDCGQKLDWQ